MLSFLWKKDLLVQIKRDYEHSASDVGCARPTISQVHSFDTKLQLGNQHILNVERQTICKEICLIFVCMRVISQIKFA